MHISMKPGSSGKITIAPLCFVLCFMLLSASPLFPMGRGEHHEADSGETETRGPVIEEESALPPETRLEGSLLVNDFLFRNGPYYTDVSAAYRTGKIDPHVLTVPSPMADQAFIDPHSNLHILVDYLCRGADNDFHKIKRIHDWMAANFYYDYDALNMRPTWNPADAGKRILPRRVCAGFAALFQQMSELAGIRCTYIVGDGKTSAGMGHAWNRVIIGGQKYEVDVTHDCLNRYIDGEYHRVEGYQDIHLFQRPETKLLWFLPSTGLDMPSIHLGKYDFLTSQAHSITPFMYGVNPEVRKPSIGPEKVYQEPENSLVGYLEDIYVQDEEALVFTMEKKHSDIEFRAFLEGPDEIFPGNGVEVRTEGEYVFCSFTAPPLSADHYRQEYKASIDIRNKTIDNSWHRIYDFLLARQYRHNYLADRSSIPKDVIRPGSTDFILAAHTEGAELVQAKFLEWEKQPGARFPFRWSAYNSNYYPLSTISYRVELPETGYYQFYLLGGPSGEFPPDTTVYCGNEKAVLLDHDGITEGEWGQYGRVPVIAREKEMIVTVGNGLMMNERIFRISFEAVRAVKVGGLPEEKRQSEEGVFVLPADDYIITADALLAGSGNADVPDQWQQKQGPVSKILTLPSSPEVSTDPISFDLLLPEEGRYQLYMLKGREEHYFPMITLSTDSGDSYSEVPGAYSGYREGAWCKVSNMPYPVDSRRIRITLGSKLPREETVPISFEALRIRKTGELNYADRENLYLSRAPAQDSR